MNQFSGSGGRLVINLTCTHAIIPRGQHLHSSFLLSTALRPRYLGFLRFSSVSKPPRHNLFTPHIHTMSKKQHLNRTQRTAAAVLIQRIDIPETFRGFQCLVKAVKTILKSGNFSHAGVRFLRDNAMEYGIVCDSTRLTPFFIIVSPPITRTTFFFGSNGVQSPFTRPSHLSLVFLFLLPRPFSWQVPWLSLLPAHVVIY